MGSGSISGLENLLVGKFPMLRGVSKKQPTTTKIKNKGQKIMDSREDLQSNKPPVIVASSVSQWVKNTPAMQDMQRHRFNLCVGKIPWRREWLPTPIFLPGETHGQGSLEGYSPWDRKESDTITHACSSNLGIWFKSELF